MLENKIKSWVLLDNNINTINKELKKKREERNVICNDIINIAENNDLTNRKIKISDGILTFNNTCSYKPISYNLLYECFLEYFKDDDKCDELLELIKNKREKKINKIIKRTYNQINK
tara:strand:- start:571 stop:921 length:351 start_codon:yes stop_codon:yes gene_type:complete